MPTEPRKPLIVISYAHADEPEHPADGNSWRRQMATSANALWETLLQGRDMPEDKDEWRKAADALAAHGRPIIEFLRAQEEGKG